MAEINMGMKIELKLNPEWRKFQSEVTQAIEIAARNVEKGAKQRIASPPDRAVDTGTTVNSIEAKPVGGFIKGENIEWRVGPVTEYAVFIEFGTWKMRARPFMIPALEDEGPRIEKAIKELMGKLD